MTQCTRFPVLTHILVCLAVLKDECVSSAMLARSIHTNPAVVRRMLALLVGKGWVTTQAGVNGGARLAVSPEKISLKEVYRLAEQDDLIRIHEAEPCCPVANVVTERIGRVVGEAQSAMEDVLERTTIADIGVDAGKAFASWRGSER